MHTDDIPVPQQVWEESCGSSRSVSEGSLNASSEQLALSGFAYQLTSIIGSDDGSIADEVHVQEEAKLLMSLSCSSPVNHSTQSSSNGGSTTTNKTNATTPSTTTNNSNNHYNTTSTGRITPSSDTSSCYSNTSSKRDSFGFTCPSLSLENHSREADCNYQSQQPHDHQSTQEPSSSSSSSQSSLPSVLLGRSLKIDDKDALRLSSEAMGRNILQSYKKALEWRIKSWEHSLSKILVRKERDLAATLDEAAMQALLTSGEANLLLALQVMETKLRVIDATTSFKVLPQRLNKEHFNSDNNSDQQHPSKKQRIDVNSAAASAGLEETEYEYQVAHAMTLEGCLNIHTPAGYCKIELEVPGSMTGTFLSHGEGEELTDVSMDVNTDILAAMIEKSSRKVIRAAAEALLKGEVAEEEEPKKEEQVATEVTEAEADTAKAICSQEDGAMDLHEEEVVSTTQPEPTTSTPKRKHSEEHMSRMVVITPAGRNSSSSPSSFGDSDYEDKPVLFSLPDSFPSSDEADGDNSPSKPSLRMLTPKPSRASNKKAKRSKLSLPTVVTPHKTQHSEAITSGTGPTLPLLVEVACAMVKK
ncbi:unnamed protein product [Cylindrotheca closterium]|uniref:Uncharacterized protein n=1 Tax=Cylindrotheca closterium TaxID=2856 RepID=A0AAD2FIP2_9STRA|nr:unnamed protein product [Cylindrotheca closterium]